MKQGNDIWIFNPDYSFKNDIDRVCMFSNRLTSHSGSPDWVGFIHPVQAMILSVFTEVRDLSSIIEDLSVHFNKPYEIIYNLIDKFKENQTNVYSVWDDCKVWFPKNVLIRYQPSKEDVLNYSFTAEDFKCTTVNLKQDRCHKGPISALWMLTNKCITNCKYCYADRNTNYLPMTTEKILDLIEELHNSGMSYIDIIGGEIFLHKGWTVILKKLVDYKMSPTYISTKIPITAPLIDQLKKTGYKNVVQISLDSVNDIVLHDMIGAFAGHVEKTKRGIALLEESGYPIQIDTVLTSKNAKVEEIDKLYEYVKTIRNLTIWEIRVPESSIYSKESFTQVMADKLSLEKIRNHVTYFRYEVK